MMFTRFDKKFGMITVLVAQVNIDSKQILRIFSHLYYLHNTEILILCFTSNLSYSVSKNISVLSVSKLKLIIMIHFIILFSRQGKIRLQKWFDTYSEKDKRKITKDISNTILARTTKMSNFVEWRNLKIVYKRYASLFFAFAISPEDNELICLSVIHRYVEILDMYFGSVCELDIIFNYERAYFILDEFIMAGEVVDTSKEAVLRHIEWADSLSEEEQDGFKLKTL